MSKNIYAWIKESGERDSVFGSPDRMVTCIGIVVSGLRIYRP